MTRADDTDVGAYARAGSTPRRAPTSPTFRATRSRMNETIIVVPDRYRGPPQSGNGGYVCGVLAGLLTGGRFDLEDGRAAEVTLRAPVPLDQPIAVRRSGDTLAAHHGEKLIAEAALALLRVDVPRPPSFEEALAVRDRSPGAQSRLAPVAQPAAHRLSSNLLLLRRRARARSRLARVRGRSRRTQPGRRGVGVRIRHSPMPMDTSRPRSSARRSIARASSRGSPQARARVYSGA